jgi:hypothetical protein
MKRTIFNPQLLDLAHQVALTKHSFVDPAMASGAAPPMDPMMAGGAAGGGAMPMDPMAGAMPPMPAMGADPAAAAAGGEAVAGGGGGLTPDDVKQIVQSVLSEQGGAGAGAGGAEGANGKPKMKIDINNEIYQLKKMMVQLLNALDQPIPADLLLGDPAQDPTISQEEAAKDPLSAAAGPGTQSAISPIQPMQGASPDMASAGEKAAYDRDYRIHRGYGVDQPDLASSLQHNSDRAQALLSLLNGRDS